MELMLRGAPISVVVLAVLAIGAADAHASHYDFTVNPNPPNEDQQATFRLTPTDAQVDRVRWDLDGDGDYNDGSSREARRTYANPGPVTVSMRARPDEDEPYEVVTKTITVNGTPTADFSFDPDEPFTGQEVSFSADATDPEGDAVTYSWTFGDGESATGANPAHAYEDADEYTVRLTVADEHGAVATTTRSIEVHEDPRPSAGFTFDPKEPMTGDAVTFSSTSTPSHGSIVAYDWDLDGDGEFDDDKGEQVTYTFTDAGPHLVMLRVTQANGERGVAVANVEVAERPPPPDPPPGEEPPAGEQPPAGDSGGGGSTDSGTSSITDPVGGSPLLEDPPVTRRLVRMRPFPVVRIAGVVLPRGADISILSVRAPRGAQVRVRCTGRGCPVGAVARTSATGFVRFPRFERRLRAGIRLELFVRQRNRIGKYTRFLIRAGKPPARTDACLLPGRARPVSCS